MHFMRHNKKMCVFVCGCQRCVRSQPDSHKRSELYEPISRIEQPGCGCGLAVVRSLSFCAYMCVSTRHTPETHVAASWEHNKLELQRHHSSSLSTFSTPTHTHTQTFRNATQKLSDDLLIHNMNWRPSPLPPHRGAHRNVCVCFSKQILFGLLRTHHITFCTLYV